MEKEITNDWYNFEVGTTIGEIGSENCKIVYDIEYINGARITIEKETIKAPFAITVGMYGIMFHTHFCSTESESQEFVFEAKKKIENLFKHLNVQDNQQSEDWTNIFNELIQKIVE